MQTVVPVKVLRSIGCRWLLLLAVLILSDPIEFAHAAELFFSLYFMTTGIHALHMIIGIGVLLYMTYRAFKNHFSAVYYDPLEMVGLYWHFVDIAWVFIFPLYYLIDKT